MVVINAYNAIEVKNNPERIIDNYVNWNYIKLSIKNNIYRIIFEFNQFYGDLIRQWSINLNTKTDVKCRYTDNYLCFDCTNGSIGVRKFENEWITWEFLLKPLGLSYKSVNINQHCISKHKLIALLKAQNIKYKLLIDTIY